MRAPRWIRKFTDPVLERVPVPIVGGVNRHHWWTLASAGSGYASGRRAAPQMRLLESLLHPEDVVWDVGAHHGYVTLCAARRTADGGEVHAFEPSPRNRRILERHLAWNHVPNARVHGVALSACDGTSCFGGGGTSKMSALGAGSDVVDVRTAASLVRDGGLRTPTFLKIDVEGAEADVVEGLLPVLRGDARLLIAMHGPDADARCSGMLRSRGFELLPSRALARSRVGPWNADPDLLCLGPQYTRAERDRRLFREVSD